MITYFRNWKRRLLKSSWRIKRNGFINKNQASKKLNWHEGMSIQTQTAVARSAIINTQVKYRMIASSLGSKHRKYAAARIAYVKNESYKTFEKDTCAWFASGNQTSHYAMILLVVQLGYRRVCTWTDCIDSRNIHVTITSVVSREGKSASIPMSEIYLT